ncbi:type II secretion system protein [Candidatus Saccharibacteria bacterium]|jgi:type II secretory pathway pseudopilin PulG|nr:type II secretion system protein [Candidatus Saccharibacteria bacterium]
MTSKVKQSGFTIIEVMLFLGITGALIAGLMIAASSNINSQRYRDTVEQLRSFIQGQYDKVYSLTNDNTSEADGSENPCVASSGAVSYKHRGTTDCLYVGRLIEVLSDATKGTSSLRVSPLIARPVSGNIPSLFGGSDTGAAGATGGENTNPVEGYDVFRYNQNQRLIENWQLDWDLGLVSAGSENNLQRLSVLIVRSPVNGAISTHVVFGEMTEDMAANLSPAIQSSSSLKEVKLCVADLIGNMDPAKRMAVIIRSGSAGPGGVESMGDEAEC